MNLKRIFLLSLILLSVSFAGPFSAEFSLSLGTNYLYTDNDYFSEDHMHHFHDQYYYAATLKPGIACYYHNTGVYFSVDNTCFDKYFILAGGIKQRIKIYDGSIVDIHIGTTWHSVEMAINSIYEFYTSLGFTSLPGLDIGASYRYKLSDNYSMFFEVNYNYNQHKSNFWVSDPPWTVRTISMNIGMMFTV